MAVRKKRKSTKVAVRKRKKTTKAVVRKRKKPSKAAVRRRAIAKGADKIANRNAQWQAYRELQMQADRAWETFRNDVRQNARSDILVKDHNHLLLLLGECNYMARECMRMATKGKKRGK